MGDISFSYAGQDFSASVPDDFRKLPEDTQQRMLFSALKAQHGQEDTPNKENKNVLDYLSMIERPSQALKVGLKESWLGSKLHQAIGGVDLTPNEGFFTGLSRGWMGNDEIRTQDYLPENMNPFLKGVLGFAGDVASDPITYAGAGTVKAVGAGLSKAGEVTGVSSVLKAGKDAAMSAKFGKNEYGLPDVLRGLNVGTGVGKNVKGQQALANRIKKDQEEWIRKDIPEFQDWLKKRVKETGISEPKIEEAFRKASERRRMESMDSKGNTRLERDDFDNPIPLLDDEGKQLLNEQTGAPMFQKIYDDFVPMDPEVQKILGEEGVAQVGKWAGIMDDLAQEGKAFGLPTRVLRSMGYFPRVLSKQGREKLADLKLDELEPEEQIKALFGTNYKNSRVLWDESFDDANKIMTEKLNEKWRQAGHGSDNPVDNYWVTQPGAAFASRGLTQGKAAQKKWFIDSITDAGYGIGPQLGSMLPKLKVEWNAANKGAPIPPAIMKDSGVILPNGKPKMIFDRWDPRFVDFVYNHKDVLHRGEHGIGTWIRTVDGVDQKRVINPDWKGRLDGDRPQFNWVPMTQADMKGLAHVDEIPEGYVNSEALDESWIKAFSDELKKRDLPTVSLSPDIADAVLNITGKRTPTAIAVSLKNLIKQSADEGLTIPPVSPSDVVSYELAAIYADEIVEAFKKSSAGKFYAPKQVARQIKDSMAVMAGDTSGIKEIEKFLKIYDRTQNTWKAWTLGVRPAYHTRNLVGNMWNAYLATGMGEDLAAAGKLLFDAGRLQYYARFSGDPQRRLDMMNNLGRLGNITKFKEIKPGLWKAKEYAGTAYSMERLVNEAIQRGVTAGHYSADNVRDMERLVEVQAGRGSKFERYAGPENAAVRAGFAIGGTVEGNARYAVFLNTLQKIKQGKGDYKWTAPDGTEHALGSVPKTPDGKLYFKTVTVKYRDRTMNEQHPISKQDMEFDTAAREVQGALFDYSDVSNFERTVLKRVMPFYTWTRKNIPLQLKHLVLNPQRAEKLALAKQQFEHETGELDHTDYGKFWGDRVPVFLGNEKDGVVHAFTLLNLMPMADLQRIQTPLALINEMVSPLLKQPFEHLYNYDTFMKTEIKKYPGETVDFMGITMRPRLAHLAKMLVPLSEINRANPAGVFGERILDPVTGIPTTQTSAYLGLGAKRETYRDEEEVARWIRFFSGVAIYNVNLDRDRYFMNKNLKADLAELKGKLKWALKKGQHRKAQQLVRLIEAVEDQETTDPFERRV